MSRKASRPVLRPLILATVLFALGLPLSGRASASIGTGNPARACAQAAQTAAAENGVPVDILGALTLTETGRRLDGTVQPWAWSVNAEGSGTWFDDPDRALAFAEDRVAQGRHNLDIGCFQLNYRWHGAQFGSVADMFDPLQNARYAARFLGQLHAETGDWRAAAGAFHSRSPGQAAKYLARFDTMHATLVRQGWAGITGEQTFNRFAGEGGQGKSAGGNAAAEDYLAVGQEVPVPDMSGSGPIDVALMDDSTAIPDGGGWQVPRLPGEAGDASAQPIRRQRVRGEPRTVIGTPLDVSARASGGSLALLGSPRGPLLQGGQALIAPPQANATTLALAEP